MKLYLLVIVIFILFGCNKEEQISAVNNQLLQKITITNKNTTSYFYEYDANDRLIKYTQGSTVYNISYNTDRKINKISCFDSQYYNFTYSANKITVEVYSYDNFSKKIADKPSFTMFFDFNTKGQITKLTWSTTFNMLLKYDTNDNLIEVELRDTNGYSRSQYFKDFDDKKNPFKDISQYQIIKFLADFTDANYDGAWDLNQFNNNPKSKGYRGMGRSEAETGWGNNIFDYEYNEKGYVTKKVNKDGGEKYDFFYR